MQSSVNKRLTRVARGTPMGNLLRRYWHPIAAVAELDDRTTKPIRLLGEDLVLYKDLGGSYGLIDRKCPHRRADLSYGLVEQHGIRCSYHGWRFDESGRCIEQPFEETALPGSPRKDRIFLAAYPVEAKAGLLWAYLGPQPAPLVPTWEPFTWANGFVQIVFSEIPCNWLQCQENSIDPVHFEWLHDTWAKRLNDRPGPTPPQHLKIDFEEFDWGIAYKRIREGQREDDELWTVGRVCLWPHALFTGGHFEWRVPMDDTNTLSVGWFFDRVPKEREPFTQERIPYWYSPVTDPHTGRMITSHIMNQDFVGWIGQGVIADRENENLGVSDRGIVMMRRRLLSDIDVVATGGEPKAIVRDPAQNQCIRLPIINRRLLVEGLTRAERDAFERKRRNSSAAYSDGFVYLAGQPEEIRKAFDEAMR